MNGAVDNRKPFEINLEVPCFKPNELSVRASENTLVIEGHHSERTDDDNGKVERHFIRRIMLPQNAKLDEMKSALSDDGVLKITIPHLIVETKEGRNIPIEVDPNWKMKPKVSREIALRQPIPLWWW